MFHYAKPDNDGPSSDYTEHGYTDGSASNLFLDMFASFLKQHGMDSAEDKADRMTRAPEACSSPG